MVNVNSAGRPYQGYGTDLAILLFPDSKDIIRLIFLFDLIQEEKYIDW
jgi:hypothetical protein